MGPLGVPNKAPLRPAPVALFFGRYFPLQNGKIGYFRPFRGTPGSAHHLPVWLMPRRLGEFPEALPGGFRPGAQPSAPPHCFPNGFPHALISDSFGVQTGEPSLPPERVWYPAVLGVPLRPDCARGRPNQGRPMPTHIPGPAFHARRPGRPMDHMQHGMQSMRHAIRLN